MMWLTLLKRLKMKTKNYDLNFSLSMLKDTLLSVIDDSNYPDNYPFSAIKEDLDTLIAFYSEHDSTIEEKHEFIKDYVIAARRSGRVCDLNNSREQREIIETASSLYDLIKRK